LYIWIEIYIRLHSHLRKKDFFLYIGNRAQEVLIINKMQR